jgi:sugar O-acyltransferase (sialic acid O-acetyltransferase NeuD family)
MISAIYCMGGYGREVYDSLINSFAASSDNEIIFVDDTIGLSTINLGGRVVSIYPFDTKHFELNECNFVIASGEPFLRNFLYNKLIEHGCKLQNIIDISSNISNSAHLGDGVIAGAFSSIQSRARIANNVAINTGAVIGHDAVIKGHTVISSHANIGGSAEVGGCTYIGMGALIKEGIKIGCNSIIGMGSVVFNDVPDDVIVLGNPARVIRRNTDQKVFK